MLKKLLSIILVLMLMMSINININVYAEGNVFAYQKDSKGKQEGIRNVEVEKIENGYRYKIFPNTQARANVGYINVEIYGSGGKIYGKIWKVGTIDSANFKFQLWSGDTSASTKMTEETVTSVPGWPLYNTISYTPAATKFWDVTLTGKLNGENMFYSTYDFLFNKKAIEYPKLTDGFGNVSMFVPSSATWSKVSNPLGTLSSTQLKTYKTWYQNTYNNGNTLNWTDVQIHHIRPRAYGGTHDYPNLMPLNKNVHSTVTTWWVNY